MIRTLFSLLLALAVAAEASAQATPGVKTKTATHTKTTVHRPAKVRSTTHKTTVKGAAAQSSAPSAPAAGGRNDIGPGGNGAVGSTESADGKGQNAYAAPGMPININNPKKVGDYNGDPAGKPARRRSGTTLTPR
ncbi:hypothetical protein [Hymenobacter terricola]|uniref:hypothetical protein n=1 Tax=Hymenobacter terricola TaxID=2819236 RepID=UPI001B315739|nr:hypothetical protein [Hymenobacter terricola]